MITIDARKRFKHAVILCHPDQASFNVAVAQQYVRSATAMGHEAFLRDLYRMRFDPILRSEERPGRDEFMLSGDVVEELSILQGSDVIVFVYPIWFGLPPAMLKGYVDRVLGAGFPFTGLRDRAADSLLTGKRLLSFSSSGTSRQWLEEQGAWMALRMVFDKYLERGFSMIGSDHIHFSSIVDGLGEAELRQHLNQVELAAQKMCSSLGAGDPAIRV